MFRRGLIPLGIAVALAVTACGSSSSSKPSTATTQGKTASGAIHCTGPGGGFPCYDADGNPIQDGNTTPTTTPTTSRPTAMVIPQEALSPFNQGMVCATLQADVMQTLAAGGTLVRVTCQEDSQQTSPQGPLFDVTITNPNNDQTVSVKYQVDPSTGDVFAETGGSATGPPSQTTASQSQSTATSPTAPTSNGPVELWCTLNPDGSVSQDCHSKYGRAPAPGTDPMTVNCTATGRVQRQQVYECKQRPTTAGGGDAGNAAAPSW